MIFFARSIMKKSLKTLLTAVSGVCVKRRVRYNMACEPAWDVPVEACANIEA